MELLKLIFPQQLVPVWASTEVLAVWQSEVEIYDSNEGR